MGSFYGNASIGSGLPQVNNSDNGKALVVNNGQWDIQNIPNGLRNLVDGSVEGSVRGINTIGEIGINAFAEGLTTKANGTAAHAEGAGTTASGKNSHAEGNNTTASGMHSHAEGNGTTANSTNSHAEGTDTIASGVHAHAEGYDTTAGGPMSHAEGQTTTASGTISHAEGDSTVASGYASHAEGTYTVANHQSQHVFGAYNIADSSAASNAQPGTYIEIVGNGYYDAADGVDVLSNARTLDWNGNEVLAGNLTVQGGSITVGNTTFTAQDFGGSLQNLVDGNTSGSVRGINTVPEGNNYSMGGNAIAEGFGTMAIGSNAHAEGYLSEASGASSHAQGDHTIAKNRAQHTFGAYNIADPSTANGSYKGTYIEIVGNGTAQNSRSNARTLDWNGNEVLAGKLTVGAAPTNNMDVATKQYVDTAVSSAGSGSGSGLPAVTAADNGKALVVDNGAWSVDNVDSFNIEELWTKTTTPNIIFENTWTGESSQVQDDYIYDSIPYDNPPQSIMVTFDDTTYTLPLTSVTDGSDSYSVIVTYGATVDDYSTYPISLEIISDSSVQMFCQDAGEHTLQIISNDTTVTPTEDFTLAVRSSVDGLQNLVDGSSAGSLRSINARSEGANYTMGFDAFAEGYGTTASGSSSHAEGQATIASGFSSHAEGGGATASGQGSHAEGRDTVASGQYSHAEGYNTVAIGQYSHAAGSRTIANHKSQYVIGEYNIADSFEAGASYRGAYVEIVGNGTADDVRSNARTLDWNGNEVLAGGLTVSATGITIGSTTITEVQLQSLLALLN